MVSKRNRPTLSNDDWRLIGVEDAVVVEMFTNRFPAPQATPGETVHEQRKPLPTIHAPASGAKQNVR